MPTMVLEHLGHFTDQQGHQAPLHGLAVLAVCFVVAACGATSGREVDKTKVATYQKGVTHCNQIRSDLGAPPLETTTEVDGRRC